MQNEDYASVIYKNTICFHKILVYYLKAGALYVASVNSGDQLK